MKNNEKQNPIEENATSFSESMQAVVGKEKTQNKMALSLIVNHVEENEKQESKEQIFSSLSKFMQEVTEKEKTQSNTKPKIEPKTELQNEFSLSEYFVEAEKVFPQENKTGKRSWRVHEGGKRSPKPTPYDDKIQDWLLEGPAYKKKKM